MPFILIRIAPTFDPAVAVDEDILDEFNEFKQIEYIERLYAINFDMIGYRRYFDRAETV